MTIKTFNIRVRFRKDQLIPSKSLLRKMAFQILSGLLLIFVLFSTGLYQLFDGWLISYKAAAFIAATVYLGNLLDIAIGGKKIL